MSDISAAGFMRRSAAPGGGGANVDIMVRNQKRLSLLQTYANDFVTSSPSAAIAMAESGASDDQILQGASEAVGFSNVTQIHKDIKAESPEVQRTVYANLPAQVQRSLNQMGYQPPKSASEGGGRLFGSIPVLGDVTERMLDWGTVPLLGGALEEVQHGGGEVLQPVGGGLKTVLNVAQWPMDQVQHAYRATVYAREEGQTDPGGWSMLVGGWSPSEIAQAWNNTEEDDGYIRPEHSNQARRLLDGNPEAYDLAKAVALHESPEKMIQNAGLEPGSMEATKLITHLQQIAGTEPFKKAVNLISTGQVSFGRSIAQELFGLDDTDHGLGRYVSGLLDAGFVTYLDPLLVAGKASTAYRFGRNAFRLESAAGVATAMRQSDLALAALRAREGTEAIGTLSSALTRVTSSDMRLGRNILGWADRVSEGFRSGDFAQMMRDLPNASTALGHMSDYHVRQVEQGLKGLDTPLGVIEYLQDRDGMLALMGTRVGGASPKVWGLRMPTFTPMDRAAAAGKRFWQDTIDWSRFVGSTPERLYGPRISEMVAAAGNPRRFSRQAGRWFASKTVGAAGRTMALLTSHTPYRDVLRLTGDDALPEFSRLINTGLFGGMSRQTMDEFVNAFAAGDVATRAKIQESFLEELFRRGGIHDTPFAQRFIGATREAYALDPESGSMRLVDVGNADVVAIPDVRGFLTSGTGRDNFTRMVFHNPATSWTEAQLARFWKPAVLVRVGFIARAAGEELLHSVLKYGSRVNLGAVGAGWQAKASLAEGIRGELRAAEAAGHADAIIRLRHSLADLEGSMAMAPFRSLMAGTDRMVSQLLASTSSDAAAFRRGLARKVERFDPNGPWRTVSGLERFADEMSLWTSGVMGRIAQALPGSLTKERFGELMAQHWNPAAAEAAHEILHNPTVARAFAENISGSTMTPWEFRSVLDGNGVPIEKVTFGEISQGRPITQEIALRPMPGEAKLDRVLNDPTFHRSIYTRHQYTRSDRVERAVVDNVLPRFTGPWIDDTVARLGYGSAEDLRRDLNDAWMHNWSEGAQANLNKLEEGERAAVSFDSGEDAVRFLRRYLDGEIDPKTPKPWIAKRLGDLFDDSGSSMSGGRLLGFLDDPDVPLAAKRWLLYQWVDPGRLITDSGDLRFAMTNAARGRLGRPDMYPALRQNRLYAKGEQLAEPVKHGISKVYVPLMPAQYTADELGDDFIEAAVARITRIGGYGPDQAETIARNVAAASVNPGVQEAASRIGMVPLAAWGAADPRITEAVMAAAEDVTGLQPTFGIMSVPDDVITRSTDQVLAQGVRRAEGAADYSIDGWRLLHTKPTAQPRRYVTLDIGEESWDKGLLSDARKAFEAPPPPDTRRLFSTDRVNWGPDVPDGPFHFVDAPLSQAGGESARSMLESFSIDNLRQQARLLGIPRYSRMKKADLIDQLLGRPEMQQTLARAGAGAIPDEVVEAAGAKRLPGLPGTWSIDAEEVSDGLPEITALERTADRTVDEIIQTLTTLNKDGVADDVLHEVVEPLNRGDRYVLDKETGVETFTPGYHFDHLMTMDPGRLPTESFGHRMMAGRDVKWSRFVKEWFDGPVNAAISSIVRKPMFINTFGEQLRNAKGMAEMLVDPEARRAVEAWAREVGLPSDEIDRVVRNIIDLDSPKPRLATDREINDVVGDATGFQPTEGQEFPSFDLTDLKRFATQRHHALNLARDNALNRAMQLTIPYIDDHRIRSAFQNYVGNFIPFMFAEEQFLKRWVRTTIESPEIIRRAQLGMNGLRAMGTVRRDDQGREVFVYPLAGDVAELISKPIEWLTGRPVSLPYHVAMTGDVGYTLPGFGNQMGVPSVGPLVGMASEELSRLFPELSEVESTVVGRGANRPLWQYLVPSSMGQLWQAGWGDIDKGQLASAMTQAVQTMAINGQLPPETATPEERQEFIDKASAQTRFILMTRGLFGMTAPAAPSVQFEHDDLTEEFRQLLQADIPFEESIRLFLANHPEADASNILAATVAQTETDFSGLGMPTDKAFDWVNRHNDLVEAYPAAAAWLVPHSEATDTFSMRAYNQQLAKGLRHRKAPKDFIDDVYFRTAAQDYFDAKSSVEERTLGLSGPARQQAMQEWRVWKDAYFNQHPLFQVMLQDPERQQKRQQATDQLIALSARDDGPVPDELRAMMKRFADFQLQISALRGDRRQSVTARRATLVGETAAWMQWQVSHHPQLAGPYLRLIDPELREADEDAVMQVVDDA